MLKSTKMNGTAEKSSSVF